MMWLSSPGMEFTETLDMNKAEDAPARIEITRRSLKDLGLL